MFKKSVITVLVLLLSAALLLAHGDPLMGTITEVGKDSITIKDKAGKSIVVMLEKSTKYLQNKKPAMMADLKVGSRVVIDAHMDAKTKKYTAEEVQLSGDAMSAKAPTAMSPKASAKKP